MSYHQIVGMLIPSLLALVTIFLLHGSAWHAYQLCVRNDLKTLPLEKAFCDKCFSLLNTLYVKCALIAKEKVRPKQ